jgi:hypothetical protein
LKTLERRIQEHINYLQNAGGTQSRYKRIYREVDFMDPTTQVRSKRFQAVTVPSKEFSNTLGTGCGELGMALAALARARAAKGRAGVTDPFAREPQPVLNDRTPMAPGGTGWAPLAAPSHLVMELRQNVFLAEQAVMQAFSALEENLLRWEAFDVLGPKNSKRNAQPSAFDEAAFFKSEASKELCQTLDRLLLRVFRRNADCWIDAGGLKVHPYDNEAAFVSRFYQLVAPVM